MPVLEGNLLDALTGVTATFLGLAVLVQILQELYKFLTSSKGRAYTKVIVDFLGPWATQILEAGPSVNLQVSGPFQIKKLSPGGILLPMDKEGLTDALERTAPHWIARAMDQLKLEVQLQDGKKSKPSPAWDDFTRELGKTEKGAPGYWNALEIAEFLSLWKHPLSRDESAENVGELSLPPEFSAQELITAFRKKFLSHVEDVDRQFPQLESNFDYAYKRRNLRQTFIIAFAIAVIFNLTFERIYTGASNLSPEEASAVAQQAIGLYESQQDRPAEGDSLDVGKQLELARGILGKTLASISEDKKITDYFVNKENILGIGTSPVASLLRFIFGCLLTAVLVSFGAPFWNDILGRIVRVRQQRKPAESGAGKE